ncbi:MAG: pyridoxal-phosphate dependent enzyme, partial [Chloroflexota bacterium]|nr:pyridoxal-phosphate dependent enzyme [Chloroflexota bacterium]
MVDVTAEAIRAAHERIPAAFRGSPQFISEPLSAELGIPVVVKVESANPIGCFKGRGTWLALAELLARGGVGEGRGVVLASAGNFGQGVAYAGRAMNVPVVVFAATTANAAKVAAMRRLGADVRLVGEDFDAARE